MSNASTPAPQKTAEELQPIWDFNREFMEAWHTQLQNQLWIAEKSTEHNQTAASFYEKVILLDSGTIALSLSVLAWVSPHMPGGHVPHSLLWLMCSAWVSLLISIYCCAMVVTRQHNTNLKLVEQVSAQTTAYCTAHFATLGSRLSVLSNNESELDVRDFIRKTYTRVVTAASDEGKNVADMLKEQLLSQTVRDCFALGGVIMTSAAFALLCAFAIKAVLLM